MLYFQSYTTVVILFSLPNVIKAYFSPAFIYGMDLQDNRPVFPAVTTDELVKILQKTNIDHTLVFFFEKSVNKFLLHCNPKYGCHSDWADEYSYYGCVENPTKAIGKVALKAPKTINADSNGELIDFRCEIIEHEDFVIVKTDDSTMDKIASTRWATINELGRKLINCALPPIFIFFDEVNDLDNCTTLEDTTAPPIQPPSGITTPAPIIIETFALSVKEVATTISPNLTIIDISTKPNKHYKKVKADPRDLKVTVKLNSGYYQVLYVLYEGIKYFGRVNWRPGSAFALHGLVFKNGRYRLRINGFQLNIKHSWTSPYDYFDNTNNVFVTPGILSGLFVVFILGSIAFWGITMIMDIKAYDRYDDSSMERFYNN